MPADASPDDGSREAVLRTRAEVLAMPARDARQSASSIVLQIGEARVAVPVQRVRCVAGPGPVARVPRSGHLLVGGRLIAGEVIALADLGPVLGAPSEAPADDRSVVVLDSATAPLGVMADRVSNTEVDTEMATGDTSPSGFVTGITSDGLLLLDVDAVLADERFTTVPLGADVVPASPAPTKGSS